MAALRGRLRLAVVAWLVLQVTALSAFVPRDCCAAHAPQVAGAAPDCHENADATHCPMRGPDGTPCPMHRGHAAAAAPHHHPADREPPAQPAGDCAMRGTCNGPGDALLTLLWQPGVLAALVGAPLDFLRSDAPVPVREHLVNLLDAPDAPPPRA